LIVWTLDASPLSLNYDELKVQQLPCRRNIHTRNEKWEHGMISFADSLSDMGPGYSHEDGKGLIFQRALLHA